MATESLCQSLEEYGDNELNLEYCSQSYEKRSGMKFKDNLSAEDKRILKTSEVIHLLLFDKVKIIVIE